MLDELLTRWRERGPVWWAEHEFGFILEDGKPIVLEPWQAAILGAWWEHRETVTTLAISNVKKTGKTTLNAVLTCWRWLALTGEHLSIANDRDQSESRQFAMVAAMCQRHPLLKQHVTETRRKLTFEPTGSTLEAIEVDAPGRAGSNHWTASHTEAWGILYESAIRAWEELTPPPGQRFGLPALRIADSYSGWEGESETWHGLVERGRQGGAVSEGWPITLAGGLLLFHMEGTEAQERCFRGTTAQRQVYYDEQRQTLRPGSYQRLHLNQRASSESAFITAEQWDVLLVEGYRCPSPGKRLRLTVGCDLSTKNDYCAVVSIYRKGDNLLLGPYRVFKPPRGAAIKLEAVEEYVLELHRGYGIGRLRYDPYQAEYLCQRLRRRGIRVEEFPQTIGNLTRCGGALFDVIRLGQLSIYEGAEDLRAHVLAAAAKETERGIRLVKQTARRKIDASVALAMAIEAEQSSPRLGGGVLRLAQDLGAAEEVIDGVWRPVGASPTEEEPRRGGGIRVERSRPKTEGWPGRNPFSR